MERKDPTGSRINKKVNYLSPVSHHHSLHTKLTKDFYYMGFVCALKQSKPIAKH